MFGSMSCKSSSFMALLVVWTSKPPYCVLILVLYNILYIEAAVLDLLLKEEFFFLVSTVLQLRIRCLVVS